MTPKPTSYEGLKEKLFWVIISAIITGVIAMVGMVWGLTFDVKLLQADGQRREVLQEKTWEIATKNNEILSLKADDSSNREQHHILIQKIDCLKIDIDKFAKRKPVYGLITPTYNSNYTAKTKDTLFNVTFSEDHAIKNYE